MASLTNHDLAPSKAVITSALNMITDYVYLRMKAQKLRFEDPLDAELTAISIASKAFHENVTAQSLGLRRKRNHLKSRLLQLPDELLSLIFLSLVEDRVPRELSALAALSVVCTQFHHIIQSTPRLWDYLTTFRSPEILAHQLEKSKHAPLCIQFDGYYPTEQSSYVSMVLPHLRRWQTAHFRGLSNENRMQLAQDIAPILQEFVVDAGDELLTSQVNNLFSGHAPLLRHLSIPTIPIPWSSPILSGLTFLSILAFDGLAVPSAAEFYGVLGSCSELEELHIIGRKEDCRSAGPTTFSYDIQLSKLSRLRLMMLHPRLVKSILSSLKGTYIPQIYVMFPKSLAKDAKESLTQAFVGIPSDSILSDILYSPRMVSLADSYDGYEFGPFVKVDMDESEEKTNFKCEFEGILSSSIIFDTIFPNSSCACIRTLSFDAVGECGGWEFVPKILANATELRDLKLVGYENKCPLEAMAPLWISHGSDGSLIWPCSNLEVLRLYWGEFNVDRLLALLECRSSGFALRELKVEGLFESDKLPVSTIARIADIIGWDGFKWNGGSLQELIIFMA